MYHRVEIAPSFSTTPPLNIPDFKYVTHFEATRAAVFKPVHELHRSSWCTEFVGAHLRILACRHSLCCSNTNVLIQELTLEFFCQEQLSKILGATSKVAR